MRLPLTETGLPFSGNRVVQDYRGDLQGTPSIVRFVTVFALNTSAAPANIDAELTTPGGVVTLPTTTLAALSATSTPVKVLDRFPLVGEVALEIMAGNDTMVTGYVEFNATDGALSPSLFTSAPDTTPFTAPVSWFKNTDGLVEIHSFDSMLQEVTLVIDVPDATAQFEVRFYEDDSTYESFVFEGLLPVMKILDRIPVYSPGSIRVLALTAGAYPSFAAYGTTILR